MSRNHPPNISLCSPVTNYDALLQVFTIDQGSEEIIEIAMNDDDYNCEEYEAPYPPSGLYDLHSIQELMP